jgi:ribulose 1,5-bisphosphate synthetase/thiazole synthase
MEIDEVLVTRKIVERYTEEFLENVDVDVVIAGAGPSSLTAARYLAKPASGWSYSKGSSLRAEECGAAA